MKQRYLKIKLAGSILGLLFVPALSFAVETYTYVPEDAVGDMKAYVDDLRFVRASWKDIPLAHKWGELWTPITWGFTKKGAWSPNCMLPTNRETITAYYAPDVPVRVTKTANGVEYLWSHSLVLSDFSKDNLGNMTYPRITNCAHLRSELRQVNKLELTKDRLALTSTLRFLKAPSGDIAFYPVIFPGTGRDRKYMPELRIMGKECKVILKDGKLQSVVYPKERESKVWLENEPRSLVFDLENVGKIRYNFSFSDPAVSLMFYQHTGWPTPSLNPYVCPAIIGKISIPAKKNFKDGIYECTFKMEVLTGDAVNEEPLKESTPTPLSLDDNLDVKIASAHDSYRYFVDEPLKFNIIVDGFKTDKKHNLTIKTRVLDYANQEMNAQKLRLSLPKDADKPLELTCPALDTGAYILEADLFEGKEKIGSKAQRFCVLNHPVDYPAEKSFFGCMSGFMRFPGVSLEDVKETLATLHAIGVKKLRWGEWWTVDWAMVEKEPGKFVFPEKFEKLDISRSVGMNNFLAPGSFEGGSKFMPGWAKSGKKTLYNYDLPKDFKAYEEYCYQVANRFKGLLDEFELENEPNYVKPENAAAAQEYIEQKAQILSTAYRGIKRAQSNAVVIAGTIGIESGATGITRDMGWLDALLKYAREKDLKLMDVMGPHYIMRGIYPEDGLDIMNYCKDIAKRYNLELWNGEDGRSQSSFHNLYPNYTFLDLEKDYANLTIRENIIQKSYGIKHVNRCHTVYYNAPRGMCSFEYEAPEAGVYYGKGGFIKPWAVAYATCAYLLEGAEPDQRLDLKVKDSWCPVFKKPDATIAAIWLKEDKGTLGIDLPADTEFVNIVGNTKIIKGKQQLAVGPEPFYLVMKGKGSENLVKSLQESQLVPDTLVELGRIAFSADKKGIEVSVTNFSKKEIKADEVTLVYGKTQMSLKKVVLAGNQENIIRFMPEKEIKNNILANVTVKVGDKTYTREEFVFFPSLETARAMGYLVAAKAKKPPAIDADLSEWQETAPIVLNQKSQIIYNGMKAEDLGGWKGADDLSAIGYMMWDETNLYFACKVTDDIYCNPFPEGQSSTWNCDSIQMAFDPLMDNQNYETYYNDDDQDINLALNQKGPVYWRRTFGPKYVDKRTVLPEGQVPGAQLAVKKWEKGLIYEFVIPFKELYPLEAKPENTFRFNFIVNDDDGGGRRQWIGITPGLGEKKALYLYKKAYLAE